MRRRRRFQVWQLAANDRIGVIHQMRLRIDRRGQAGGWNDQCFTSLERCIRSQAIGVGNLVPQRRIAIHGVGNALQGFARTTDCVTLRTCSGSRCDVLEQRIVVRVELGISAVGNGGTGFCDRIATCINVIDIGTRVAAAVIFILGDDLAIGVVLVVADLIALLRITLPLIDSDQLLVHVIGKAGIATRVTITCDCLVASVTIVALRVVIRFAVCA